MKFFVTGVGGQLGHDVMNELIKRGHEGVGSDIQEQYSGVEDGSEVTKAPYLSLDITDKEAVKRVIESVKPDAVIHCAALKAVGESVQKPLEYYQNNITGTLTLMDVMNRVGVKNIVFSSSATVYGSPEEMPITESCPKGILTDGPNL